MLSRDPRFSLEALASIFMNSPVFGTGASSPPPHNCVSISDQKAGILDDVEILNIYSGQNTFQRMDKFITIAMN